MAITSSNVTWPSSQNFLGSAPLIYNHDSCAICHIYTNIVNFINTSFLGPTFKSRGVGHRHCPTSNFSKKNYASTHTHEKEKLKEMQALKL
jgi:hypothetical protein